MSKKKRREDSSFGDADNFPKSISYPENEDIYQQGERESLANDEQETNMDIDLDLPGAELDDYDEFIGEEDEENNYYSLGGDDHNDLEEE